MFDSSNIFDSRNLLFPTPFLNPKTTVLKPHKFLKYRTFEVIFCVFMDKKKGNTLSKHCSVRTKKLNKNKV